MNYKQSKSFKIESKVYGRDSCTIIKLSGHQDVTGLVPVKPAGSLITWVQVFWSA